MDDAIDSMLMAPLRQGGDALVTLTNIGDSNFFTPIYIKILCHTSSLTRRRMRHAYNVKSPNIHRNNNREYYIHRSPIPHILDCFGCCFAFNRKDLR
jgi:hypothetical protein